MRVRIEGLDDHETDTLFVEVGNRVYTLVEVDGDLQIVQTRPPRAMQVQPECSNVVTLKCAKWGA